MLVGIDFDQGEGLNVRHFVPALDQHRYDEQHEVWEQSLLQESILQSRRSSSRISNSSSAWELVMSPHVDRRNTATVLTRRDRRDEGRGKLRSSDFSEATAKNCIQTSEGCEDTYLQFLKRFGVLTQKFEDPHQHCGCGAITGKDQSEH